MLFGEQLASGNRALRVLLVDEDVTVHNMVAPYFRHTPHLLDSAMNSEEALQRLESHKYELSMVDLRMQDANGMSLLMRIREQYEEMMVAVMSQEVGLKHVVNAMHLGAIDFMTKPFDLWELDALVKRCLRHMTPG